MPSTHRLHQPLPEHSSRLRRSGQPSPPSLPLFPLHCACSLQSNLLLSRQASVRLIWSFQVRRMEVKTEGNYGCEGDDGHEYTHKLVFIASVQEQHENSTKQDQPSVEKPLRRRSAKRHDRSEMGDRQRSGVEAHYYTSHTFDLRRREALIHLEAQEVACLVVGTQRRSSTPHQSPVHSPPKPTV
ncbi:hypothetical protein Q8A67_018359 [Cirrhinus molitorella]|uniref:Uncharacterized protein n=1 Tax=Cirrhinus molitorella TaxID=172907 RepID=A0AA88PG31_9TELE|nr:hypothetical protein Q8A67_018359 [Cirrhinus molitorella]